MTTIEERKGHGTREWSEESLNSCIGCRNDCIYCYGPSSLVYKFEFLGKKRENWKNMRLIQGKTPKKVNGVIMYPTRHDLFPEHIEHIKNTLSPWLKLGNKFLIVSKPRMDVIVPLCKWLKEEYLGVNEKFGFPMVEQIEFRFTVGTMDDKIQRFWEPNAPEPIERERCIRRAVAHGFKVSVSEEPFLDENVYGLTDHMLEICNGDVWIGKMNSMEKRVDKKYHNHEYFKRLSGMLYSDEFIMAVVDAFKDNPRVRWKDSIKEVINRVK